MDYAEKIARRIATENGIHDERTILIIAEGVREGYQLAYGVTYVSA